MKIRRLRKRQQSLFKRHRAYYWSVQKLADRIFEAYRPMAKALEQAYGRGNLAQIINDNGSFMVVEIPKEEMYGQTTST